MKKFLKLICIVMALSVMMSLFSACNAKSDHEGDKFYEACMLMSSMEGMDISQAETKLEETFGIKLDKQNEEPIVRSDGYISGNIAYEYEADIRIQCIDDTGKTTQVIYFNEVEIWCSEDNGVNNLFLKRTNFTDREEAESQYEVCKDKAASYFNGSVDGPRFMSSYKHAGKTHWIEVGLFNSYSLLELNLN